MKKTYLKPTMQIVMLRQRSQLLNSSPIDDVQTTGLDPDDEFSVSDEPGSGWSR